MSCVLVGLPTAFVVLSSVMTAASADDNNRRHQGQKDDPFSLDRDRSISLMAWMKAR